ncbi:hypothetical protein [Pseudosulfitobacter pseudonitzschiae]|uniref:hypothetical protein n=1 Tax=Pseudosulfitobacter pseudonitzschiae TaxID=1402135 RepID=UPI003B7EAB78
MVDFRKLVSPKSRRKIAERYAFISEFETMSDAEKAEVLLTKSRSLIDSGVFSSDQRYSYDEWALYRVIPEIALRLDHTVTLRETEHPKEDERKDQVTWLRNASRERLHSAVMSVIGNCSFSRATTRHVPVDVRLAADLLLGMKPNLITLAAEAIIPQIGPEPKEPDERPPLTGTYLIASLSDDMDRVLRYSEDPVEISRAFDLAIAMCRGEDTESDDDIDTKMMTHFKEGYFFGVKLNTIQSVSLQTFDGEILQIEKIDIQDREVSLDL